MGHLLMAAVLGFGGWFIIQGQMTIGSLVAFQALLPHVTTPIQQLVGFSSQLQEIKGDLTRIDDAQKYELDPLVDVRGAGAAQPALERSQEVELTGRVEIRDVDFRYGPLDPMLIQGLNLSLEPGARVALVGGSGSGKSTIARMIVGLYGPSAGAILFDGKRHDEIPRELFTQAVAYVDQDIYLFEGTVRDNIAMWDEDIPQERVRAAADDACIHDVVAARPGGYNSRVSEGGGNFSGGQRQRLEIARALVRDPSLVVLDEATAALDPLTEQIIDRNLRRRGCTCVIIAHRLSTIRDADEILVLDRGTVIERGDHDTLIARGGRYAELVASE
jgi:ABC-type bacteriocin/lantibiotic exporter with double-glycine peptidase domain